jgi:hypothetical protein
MTELNRLYTPEEFYQSLKLDIWHFGRVSAWGRVEKISAADLPIRKNYGQSSIIKRHLGTGLYLLDLYLQETDRWSENKVYIAVIAVCRTTLDHIQTVHYLRAVNNMTMTDLKDFIYNKHIIKKLAYGTRFL